MNAAVIYSDIRCQNPWPKLCLSQLPIQRIQIYVCKSFIILSYIGMQGQYCPMSKIFHSWIHIIWELQNIWWKRPPDLVLFDFSAQARQPRVICQGLFPNSSWIFPTMGKKGVKKQLLLTTGRDLKSSHPLINLCLRYIFN